MNAKLICKTVGDALKLQVLHVFVFFTQTPLLEGIRIHKKSRFECHIHGFYGVPQGGVLKIEFSYLLVKWDGN
jgi:hypothetical protein